METQSQSFTSDTPLVPIAASDDEERIALEITRELFPGSVEIEDGADPADPSNTWKTLVVTMKGSSPEILAQKSRWHHRMFAAFGPERVSLYTICVVPERRPDDEDLVANAVLSADMFQPDPSSSPADTTISLDEAESIVRRITAQLFSDAFQVETECDPSYPEYTWRLVTVTASGSTRELLEREAEWNRRTYEALGSKASCFSLCLYPACLLQVTNY